MKAKLMPSARCMGIAVIIGGPHPFHSGFIIGPHDGKVASNPLCLPIFDGKESHLPPTGEAVRRRHSALIPCSNLPVIPAPGLQRWTVVRTIDRLVRLDSDAVPHIGLAAKAF